MKKLLLLMALIVTCCFMGCFSSTVTIQGNLPKDMLNTKVTYGWFQHSPPSSDLRVNNSALHEQIQKSVDRQLQAKGYKKVIPQEANYLVSWFGSIAEDVKEINVSDYYSSYGYGFLAGRISQLAEDGKVRKTFSKGTLILDVLDPASKQILWRGSATNALKDKMTSKDVIKYIDHAVKQILKDLPGEGK